MSAKGDFVLGKVEVHSTENKGHDPEFWATQATKKIVSISANAPDHIKQQALAFQNQVYTVILYSMKNAIKSQNTTLINLLIKQGHEDMARIIKEL
jgi:phosphoribosyl-dephospho-CoA transferase